MVPGKCLDTPQRQRARVSRRITLVRMTGASLIPLSRLDPTLSRTTQVSLRVTRAFTTTGAIVTVSPPTTWRTRAQEQ